MAAQRAFETGTDLPYLRYDAHSCAPSPGMRHRSAPRTATRPARVFELRTYEARTLTALERKIAMFNEAEIALFRSLDMTPVFFGENLFGTRLPSLTYMLTFEDMTARYKAWAAFGATPSGRRIDKDETIRPPMGLLGQAVHQRWRYSLRAAPAPSSPRSEKAKRP